MPQTRSSRNKKKRTEAFECPAHFRTENKCYVAEKKFFKIVAHLADKPSHADGYDISHRGFLNRAREKGERRAQRTRESLMFDHVNSLPSKRQRTAQTACAKSEHPAPSPTTIMSPAAQVALYHVHNPDGEDDGEDDGEYGEDDDEYEEEWIEDSDGSWTPVRRYPAPSRIAARTSSSPS